MPTTATPTGAHVVEIQGTTQIDGQTVTRTGTVALNVATPGQTLLVGQVLDGEDRPLPGVSVKLGGTTLTHLGFSDTAGNVFIPLSVSGPQVFLIDGSTANNPTMYYSTIPITLDIQAGLVNELGYVPRLRGQPAVKLTPLVPGQATVITDPDLPGFKMTIPAGAQIIGWDGQPNAQFGVTTVSIDRSPLPPLPPGLEARQTYLFSFGKVGGGKPTGNIPIDTANDVGGLPGEKIDLYYFNEAPDGTAPNQWEKYGTGTVSSDGTTIVTDVNPATGLPYGMPRFCCGARTNVRPPNFSTPGGGPSGGASDSGKRAGDPVDTATGFFYVDKTDMVLAGRIPIVITRTYRTNLNNQGPFGIGTSWPYDVHLASPPDGSGDTSILVSAGNRQDYFSRVSLTTFESLTSPALRGAELRVDLLRLRFKDGSFWQFDSTGRLESQTDRNGNVITFSRDTLGRIVRIELFRGGALSINYTDAGIASITDSIGRQVRYSYDSLGRLETVTDPSGGITRYTYDSNHRMLTLTDPRGITFLMNEYDSNGRLARQTQADGGVWTFDYTSSGSFVSQTTVTNPLGEPTTYRFNTAGYQVSETDALGQTASLQRQAGTNLVLSATDPLKRVTRFEYDGAGNVTRITDPANNVRTFTYDPAFHKVTSSTDPLGQVTRFEYDSAGKLTATVDPLGNRRTISYDSFGQPTNTTDPLGDVTAFAYDNTGNLTAITNPLGNRLQRTYDEVARLTSQTDPRGKTTSFVYDPLNRVTRITNPAGGLTQFSYDANGNLLSVSDARGSVTGYTYDSMDRLATRRDPLGAIESFQYDAMGNLTRHIDRVGQIAAYSYDPLNRRTSASYGDGASTNLVYDAVGRLTQAADSTDGLIAHQYDNLNRLIAQISSLGTVSYEYDSLNRRTSMNVPGQSPVTYGYDQASHLRQIVQGTSIVDFNYDALSRRTGISLPNGVLTEYQYDPASRLTALIYRNAVGVLGDLTYQYDKAGNRTGVGGSFARTLLPDAVNAASYDAANRQVQFGDKTMAYDANGNMTTISDPSGSTTYSWDARNQLVALSGAGNMASFVYDVLGRRSATTIKGERVQYLYDGMNPVQETNGAPVLANSLTGLGIDEYFNRTDSSGSQQVLADALGSTIALTDGNGSIQTEYNYEPFGRTTVSGASRTNPFQYTGRENDGTGLYYYRARYYHPTLQRFVSEDPIGFGGGDVNIYLYVGNRPLSIGDPLGLYFSWVHGATSFLAGISEGMSLAEAAFLAGTNIGADFHPGSQSERSANEHAMRRIDQTAEEGRIETEKFINQMLEPTGNWLFDHVSLGRAVHSSDDSFAAGHSGYQEWTGEYGSFSDWAIHAKGDVWPGNFGEVINAQREIIRRYKTIRILSGRKG
jgi:RHS repeat-associated protein